MQHILLTSTSYPQNSQDWRGRFIASLVAALAKNADYQFSIWAPPGEVPPTVLEASNDSDREWLEQLMLRGGIAHLLRTKTAFGAVASFQLLRRLQLLYSRHKADLYHVNWLQNALPLIGSHTPAVISVLGSDFGLLKLPGMRQALSKVVSQRACILAPNASWMAPLLEDMFGAIASVQPIAFGVDNLWFDITRAADAGAARKWLVVSRLTSRKIGPLFSWGKELFTNGRELHLFGPMQEQMKIPDWVHYHGATHPRELAQHWFPAASGLLTLSTHDEGRPQVMLEAMAAGMPVIASDIPAHRDIIERGKAGLVVGSMDALETALHTLEDTATNTCYGLLAREWVLHNVGTWSDCAARYVNCYEQLLT